MSKELNLALEALSISFEILNLIEKIGQKKKQLEDLINKNPEIFKKTIKNGNK